MCLDRGARLPPRAAARPDAGRGRRRVRIDLTSAIFYATFLLPEALAYPVFALCRVPLHSRARGRWAPWIDRGDRRLAWSRPQVRGELAMLAGACAPGAIVLFAAGPHEPRGCAPAGACSTTSARGSSSSACSIVLNQIASARSPQYAVVTQAFKHRMWTLGFQAGSALAIGLGLLPAIAGLASLWLPQRRHEPAWRAFAAFTASACSR